jgi:hypothetical protein
MPSMVAGLDATQIFPRKILTPNFNPAYLTVVFGMPKTRPEVSRSAPARLDEYIALMSPSETKKVGQLLQLRAAALCEPNDCQRWRRSILWDGSPLGR